MDMTNTQKANLATMLVSMCRECNDWQSGAMERLEGAEDILNALDLPFQILRNAESDRYTAVELCGEVYTV